MYTHRNFKTKKALREAVAAYNANPTNILPVGYYQPGPFGGNEVRDGTIFIEGPHYPAPHKWYAQCEAKDGIIISVK